MWPPCSLHAALNSAWDAFAIQKCCLQKETDGPYLCSMLKHSWSHCLFSYFIEMPSLGVWPLETFILFPNRHYGGYILSFLNKQTNKSSCGQADIFLIQINNFRNTRFPLQKLFLVFFLLFLYQMFFPIILFHFQSISVQRGCYICY